MITDMTIMLYVKNVDASSKFWQALGFEEAMREDLGGTETSLLMYGETGAALQLYDIDFIRQTQPDQAEKKPVLLFSASVIDELYEKAKAVAPEVSDLMPYGDQYVFVFADLDGNQFTLMGEKVDVPDTPENMAAFDDHVAGLFPLKFEDVESLLEPAVIFFGRRTCPWSRHMAQQFPELKTPLYFVNTEGSDAAHPIREKYGVKTVPTLIKRASNGMYVKYNAQKMTLKQFLHEK
ncbi:MAG: hypothetical protein LBI11_03320 [Streptococcaceae bacterium]|jgi:predicted lactoylglutathione lyase|nr:hypothetical protein [Streptococcaceae bacterium]